MKIKKILVVVCGLCFIASLTGCSRQYSAEKLYWQAGQTARKVQAEKKDKEAKLSSEEIEVIINAYRKVVEKCPLTPPAARAQLIITQAYLSQEEFEKAQQELIKITQDYRNMAPQARFMVGSIYEQQGDWDKAVIEYEKVMDLYGATTPGLQTPIYIAKHYQEENQSTKADDAYSEAARRYKQNITDYSGTSLEPALRNYLGMTYYHQGKWTDAVDVWQGIARDYPNSLFSFQLPLFIAEHYLKEEQVPKAEKLFAESIERYQKIIEENPNTPPAITAQDFISRSYLLQKKWDKAAGSLKTFITNYPDDPRTVICLFTLGTIYGEKLNEPEEANRIYKDLIEKYPENRLAKVVNKILDNKEEK